MPDEDLVQYYEAADIFVAPSRFESFGLIAVEAMRSGCAVIASDIGGLREVVDGSIGFLVAVDDAEALALRLQELIADQSLRLRMGMDARRKFENAFTSALMAERLEQYFRELL